MVVPIDHWRYIANHVFSPRKLPQESDFTQEKEHALATLLLRYAREFRAYLKHQVPRQSRSDWDIVVDILSNLQLSSSTAILAQEEVQKQLEKLAADGGVRAFLVRTQNAALVVRRDAATTLFEMFEVSPSSAAVVGTVGKLLISYPGPAVSVANEFVDAHSFIPELANFLARMDEQDFPDAAPHTKKAGLVTRETRDTVHPMYITELLTGILLGHGEVADVPRVAKRIGDEVLWRDALLPWRRSSLWLVIRVALQTTLQRGPDGLSLYKSFMIFVQSRFLEELVAAPTIVSEFNSDMLFCMSAKTSRRAYKLSASDVPTVARIPELVLNVAEKVKSFLEQRHAAVLMPPPPLPPITLTQTDFERDIELSLTNSRPFIDRALALSRSTSVDKKKFTPRSSFRQLTFHDHVAGDFRDLIQKAGDQEDEIRLTLINFETAVATFRLEEEYQLGSWCHGEDNAGKACIAIKGSVELYHSTAASLYSSNPETMSIHYLIVLLIWVFLDRILLHEMPLLWDYKPDIDVDLFDVLLLRSTGHYALVSMARGHLTERHRRASLASVLTQRLDSKSFPVRSFDTSPKMQALKEKIELDAGTARDHKLRELEEKQKRYDELMASANALDHHRNEHFECVNCTKCQNSNTARSLSIGLHEWPLPRDEDQAKACIFELMCPTAFAVFRDATAFCVIQVFAARSGSGVPQGDWYGLLSPPPSVNFFSVPVKKKKRKNKNGYEGGGLKVYEPLSKHRRSTDYTKRVAIASSTKPFTQAHYRTRQLSQAPTASDVAVNCGLEMTVVDLSMKASPRSQESISHSLAAACTYQLPQGIYSSLAFALGGTLHSTNQVIAKQSSCDAALSLQEFYEFGALRSGALLQWMNLLRLFRARSINFRDEPVHLLICQSVLQIGVSDGSWHAVLSEDCFTRALLRELTRTLRDIRDNWLEIFTLRSVLEVVLRLLVDVQDPSVIAEVISCLRQVRVIVLGWLREALTAEGPTRDSEMHARISMLSALCLLTFDGNATHLPALMNTDQDIEAYVHSSIRFRRHASEGGADISLDRECLHERVRRVHVSTAPFILFGAIASRASGGIDQGIQAVWRGFRPDVRSSWISSNAPGLRWVECEVENFDLQVTQTVRLDLLSGALLVNGQLIGRMPSTITNHPTYKQVFGSQILEILPANVPGMQYMAVELQEGRQVYFTLQSNDLFITTVQPEGPSLALIPVHTWDGDLPSHLVKGHTHWIDVVNRDIYIQRDKEKWRTRAAEWMVQYSPSRSVMARQTDDDRKRFSIDLRSKTFATISKYLDAIELPPFQFMTLEVSSDGAHCLKVELPRSGYSFVLENQTLVSRELGGFVVDPQQYTGTMLSLRNQLVLKESSPSLMDKAERRVIIPRGLPYPEVRGSSTSVSISLGPDDDRMSYGEYKVDPLLKRLKFQGIPDLYTRLQQIYLHAVTSLCLTDPLTARTGTETALDQLENSGLFSFPSIASPDVDLLNMIAELTPMREFYPRHLKVMESVRWHPGLGCLAQHDTYVELAKNILDHYARVHALLPVNLGASDMKLASSRLLLHQLRHRSLSRSSLHCRARIAGNREHRPAVDAAYGRRDLPSPTGSASSRKRFPDVLATSRMVSRWSQSVTCSPLPDLYLGLKPIADSTGGIKADSSITSLTYHQRLRGLPSGLFLTILGLCQRSPSRSSLLFTLSILSYLEEYGWRPEYVSTLYAVALSYSSDFTGPVSLQYHSSYHLLDGLTPETRRLEAFITEGAIAFDQSAIAAPRSKSLLRGQDDDQSRREEYCAAQKRLKPSLLDDLLTHWNTGKPVRITRGDLPPYFHTKTVSSEANKLFDSCRRNKELCGYLQAVQTGMHSRLWVLSGQDTTRINISASPLDFEGSKSAPPFPQILHHRVPSPFSAASITQLSDHFDESFLISHGKTASNLSSLVSCLRETNMDADPYSLYADRLVTSIQALESEVEIAYTAPPDVYERALAEYNAIHAELEKAEAMSVAALGPRLPQERALAASGLWPDITIPSLFRVLEQRFINDIPSTWKCYILSLAQLTIMLQTARRQATLASNPARYRQLVLQLVMTRRRLWQRTENPDWLLLQIESDFTIRDVQSEVATTMLAEKEPGSLCLQLNMGEGKSSVIAPMVVCALADGRRLARVIVLKSLLFQMAQTMSDRLSGLVNRRVYFLPFSRTTFLDAEKLASLDAMIKDCITVGGVLIVQPEHVLSLKLRAVGAQFHGSEDFEHAHAMARILYELDSTARDVLDESDEILHVRYQLAYTWGTHESFHGHPTRWTIAQTLLHLASTHIQELHHHFPDAFVSQGRSSLRVGDLAGFPPLRILETSEALDQTLLTRLIDDVMAGRLDGLNVHHLEVEERRAIRSFIALPKLPPDVYLTVSRIRTKFDAISWNAVLILHGLLGLGILTHTLKGKRYRVDYGLDLSRSQLAVPYRAKDIPSLSAEFAHPDVVIVLTCLTYYFHGLSESQIDMTLRMLRTLDDPEAEYSSWVLNAGPSDRVPESLRTFKGLNFDSMSQRPVICALFTFNMSTINFYLRSIVFPKEAKVFQSRLGCSAWDIVEPKKNVATGFSGTNDFQHLLPTHITQKDPAHQLSTNARVLNHLLQAENDHYEVFDFPNGEEFLKAVSGHEKEFRMILDVGAQMLDIGNRDLVALWLTNVPSEFALAGIYVNEADQAIVLHRSGHEEPLTASYIGRHLDRCVVYLDDAHTRGIDLQLPLGFRAAVTLGPKVTKDRLAQGCMRLRRLGAGQSVSFFSPKEVDTKIRQYSGLNEGGKVQVKDVLLWTITETCLEMKHRAIQWAYQGLDHEGRRRSLDQYRNETGTLGDLKSSWIRPEARTLDEMYGLDANKPLDWFLDTKDHPQLQERCTMLGLTVSDFVAQASLEEEQEREVAHEIEREQQVERPSFRTPLQHSLHPDVRSFVLTGRLSKSSQGFAQAFTLFQKTTAELPGSWKGRLWMTRDFVRTVETASIGEGVERDYVRPVHWIVSSTASSPIFIVFSPFEVNELYPDIIASSNVQLHVFAPRLTLAMAPCDDLSLFSTRQKHCSSTIPHRVRLEIILFSGQLYLGNHEQYLELCELLGLYADDLEGKNVVADIRGFIPPERRLGIRRSAEFLTSPVVALTELMTIRRRGLTFNLTHIGKILSGRQLFRKDSSFPESEVVDSQMQNIQSV